MREIFELFFINDVFSVKEDHAVAVSGTLAASQPVQIGAAETRILGPGVHRAVWGGAEYTPRVAEPDRNGTRWAGCRPRNPS